MAYHLSLKNTARLAGFLYFLQIPLGIFGLVYIPKTLIISSDLEKTTANILANETLFRFGMVSTIICALVTVATAVLIASILKPVQRTYAQWIVTFTLIAAPISMLNELNHVAILLLAKNPPAQPATTQHLLLSLFLNLHQYGIKIIDIFFGLWLLPMGYLVMKSGYIPKIIGVLLLVTCVGYLADFVLFYLFPGANLVVSEYTWLGEVLMVLWLLIKGVDTQQSQKQ